MRRAANSSASRSGAGSLRSASFARSAGTCKAAAEAGFQRSKRSVYSRRAASPRRRTASRICAVARSTPSSWVASKASRRSSASSNPGSDDESRRGSGTARLSERFDERRERVALQLERGGIDDEPARDRKDLLDDAQAVGAQRIARIDEVDDRIGEADEGRQLH